MAHEIAIDAERCIGCGMCVRDCFVSCIELVDKLPRYVEGGAERCLACQHCMTVCPKTALSLDGMDPDACGAVVYGDPATMLDVMKSRRSVRQYRKGDVPPEKIDAIVEMLAYPPTGGNADNLHFTIIGTREKMDELREATYAAVGTLSDDSPLASLKGMLQAMRAQGTDMVYRDAPALVVAAVDKGRTAPGCEMVDPTIALSYLELYAWSLGLGTLWDDLAVALANTLSDVRSLLRIPEGYDLGFILTLGVPAVKYARTPQKKVPSVTVV